MRSSKSFFFAIVGLAILLVIGLVFIRFLFIDSLDLPAGLGEISIQVVAAPSIKPWADQAAREFNDTNRNVQVRIIAADRLIPEAPFLTTQQETPPAAWLAEASFAVEMAANSGLQFEDAQSVATTTLAWGAYNDRLEQFNQAYGPLEWDNLRAKATNPDDILKIVIASPQNSAAGIAALASATAAQVGQPSLSASDVSAANEWLTEIFGDRNTQIPPTPAQTFAGVQGRTIGDVGLLTMASWRSVGLDQSAEFTVAPADPNLTLDYPLAIWAGERATPEARQAALAFRDFLLSEAQQNGLAQFSFEPAGAATGGLEVDAQAATSLLRWAERELR